MDKALNTFAKSNTLSNSYDNVLRSAKDVVYFTNKTQVKNTSIVVVVEEKLIEEVKGLKPFAIVSKIKDFPILIYEDWRGQICYQPSFSPCKGLKGFYFEPFSFNTVFRSKLKRELLFQLNKYNRQYNENKSNISNTVDDCLKNCLKEGIEDKAVYEKILQVFKAKKSDASLNSFKYRAQILVDMLPNKLETVLDFACGKGYITYWLKELLNCQVYGYDIRDVREEEVKKSFTFLNSPIVEVDLVVCSLALHHFEDLDCQFKQLSSCVKKDGYLLILEHDCKDKEFAALLNIIHGLWSIVFEKEVDTIDQWINSYVCQYASKEEWKKYIEKQGFEEVKSKCMARNDPQGRYLALYKKE